MSTALVAVADGNQVRGYHRSADGALIQVAQFLVATVVEPAELAAIVADLSDKFGWAEGQPPPPQARPAPGLPASRASKPAASAPPPKRSRKGMRYSTPEQAAAQRAAILHHVRYHPGCTRREIAAALVPDEDDRNGLARITYLMKAVTNQLVITPGSSPRDPDRFRLRLQLNGDG